MDEKIKFVCDECGEIQLVEEHLVSQVATAIIMPNVCDCGGQEYYRYHCPDLDWDNPEEARKIFEAWAGGREITDGVGTVITFNEWCADIKQAFQSKERGKHDFYNATFHGWHLHIPEKEKDLITPSVVLIGPVYTCPICGEEATVTHGEETVYETHTCGACTGAICITLVEIATYGQWYNVSKNCWREETYLDESYDASNWHTHPDVQKRWAEIGRTCRPGEEKRVYKIPIVDNEAVQMGIISAEAAKSFYSENLGVPFCDEESKMTQGTIKVISIGGEEIEKHPDETDKEYMDRALRMAGADCEAVPLDIKKDEIGKVPESVNYPSQKPALTPQYEYTHTAKFEFENGDTVEIPAPGDEWEMVYDDSKPEFDKIWTFNTFDDNFIKHPQGKLIFTEYFIRLRQEKHRIYSVSKYRREVKPPETAEPERYQSAYEFL